MLRKLFQSLIKTLHHLAVLCMLHLLRLPLSLTSLGSAKSFYCPIFLLTWFMGLTLLSSVWISAVAWWFMVQCYPWWGLSMVHLYLPTKPSCHGLESFLLLHVWLSHTICCLNNKLSVIDLWRRAESTSNALLPPSPPNILRQGLSLNLELMVLARLDSQKSPGIHPSTTLSIGVKGVHRRAQLHGYWQSKLRSSCMPSRRLNPPSHLLGHL